jgi:pseudouridine synthase
MIQEGRVAVYGQVSFGDMVVPFVDEISLDGKIIKDWEAMNGIAAEAKPRSTPGKQTIASPSNNTSTVATKTFEYVKYNKPQGVICTTDQRIKDNIIDALTQKSGYCPKHRVYPVGRLDKDSTGLIIITSDGRLPNASLRRDQKQSKIYRVRVDQPLRPDHLEELRSGIVITTVAQRDGKSKPLTAKTKPCTVTSLSSRDVEIILQEGRNRQIRKMMGALGYEVIRLHRVGFGEITLDADMKAGDWKVLNANEMQWIRTIVE